MACPRISPFTCNPWRDYKLDKRRRHEGREARSRIAVRHAEGVPIVQLLPLLLSVGASQNPPVGLPGGRWNPEPGFTHSNAVDAVCDFPDDSDPRKPVRFTGLGYGYYPAFWCRGWYGAFPGLNDDLDAKTVSFAVLDHPFSVGVTAAAQLNQQGGALELAIASEGRRFGLAARGLMLALNRAGAVGGNDETSVINVHVTFAVVSDPRGRLRIEGGFAEAFAPQTTSPGLSLGISGALGVAGPVGIEVSAQLTPIPYHQYDLHGAATVAFANAGLSLGWRTLYFDGLGPLDEYHDHAVFNGPFVALSLKI